VELFSGDLLNGNAFLGYLAKGFQNTLSAIHSYLKSMSKMSFDR
jgi:hypothetical protein